MNRHHPPAPSSEEEGEQLAKAPSSSEEGVGGGGVTRKVLLKRAAEMRGNPTEPERRLWMALRNSRFFGYKFRRQTVIGFRVVDMFCPAKGVVIELDGDTHDAERDFNRDRRMLRDFGFRTVRFTNHELITNPDGVLTALKLALDVQPERWPNRRGHHPSTPSSEEEGEA